MQIHKVLIQQPNRLKFAPKAISACAPFAIAVAIIATIQSASIAAPPPIPIEPPRIESVPPENLLSEIATRGRDIADYDNVCWHATDALKEKFSPKTKETKYFLAEKSDKGWTVYFGKLNDDEDKFLIVYEATCGQDPKSAKEVTVKKLEPPKEDTSKLFMKALALRTCHAVFLPGKYTYNCCVLSAPNDQYYVYFYPGSTTAGLYLLGGDVRYRVAHDGQHIVETRTLHRSVLPYPRQIPETMGDYKALIGLHSALVDNIPEDTDVFHVLSRRPKVPEMIITKKFVYQIGVDGNIEYMGTFDEFRKKLDSAAEDEKRSGSGSWSGSGSGSGDNAGKAPSKQKSDEKSDDKSNKKK